MMNLILHRTDLRQDCTLGVLELIPHQEFASNQGSQGKQSPLDNGTQFQCATLEPPVKALPMREGQGGSAIPRGKYKVNWQWSTHFGKKMPFLENVPGFTGIMIHPGNTARDTKGCILVGQPSGTNQIVNSRKTFADLEALLLTAKDPIWITICN